ncbi:MAG: VWA domain-containing protein [Rhizobiaceae bacterium]
MHINRSIFACIAFLAAMVLGSFNAHSRDNGAAGRVMLVLDASGSMWAEIGGKDKIVIAREVVRGLMSTWNPDMELGLSAYGHRAKGDCNDIQTLLPIGKNNAKAVAEKVDTIKPKGKTPLSQAVRLAAEHLSYAEKPATVILVTDGIETCNADPCALGRQLAKTGVDFRAHVVGFGIAKKDQSDLQCLAESTGGLFFDAKNASDLSQALNLMVARVEEESGPKHQFNAVLADGAEILPRGWYAQNLSWKFFVTDNSRGKSGNAVHISTGADAAADLDSGTYVAELSWDAIRVNYPFQIDASEKAQFTFNLNGGLVDLSAALNSSSGNVTRQIGWNVFAADADNTPAQKLLYKLGAAVKIAMPAGEIIISAKLDSAIAEKTISIDAGSQTAEQINFRAGSTKFVAVDGPGNPVKGYQTWTVYIQNADGTRRKVAFKGNSNPLFTLASGNYLIELGYDKSKFESEFTVVEGQQEVVELNVSGS